MNLRWLYPVLGFSLTALSLFEFFQYFHNQSISPAHSRDEVAALKLSRAKNDLYRYDSHSNPPTGLAPVATTTPLPAGVYVMRVNADGVSMVSADGRVWAQDQAYSPNSFGYTGNTLIVTGNCSPQGVDPADYPLFNTIRYSMYMDYKFDLPQADTYHVTLYFNECFHNPGESRQFKILMQGVPVDEFDLVPLCVASDGNRSLLAKSYEVAITPSNLTLEIGFRGVNDNALVSAIQVNGTVPVKLP